jgi:hypothetical protein
MGALDAALPAGATSELIATDPTDRANRRVGIQISRPADRAAQPTVRLALVAGDWIAPPPLEKESDDAAATQPAKPQVPPAPAPQQETVLVDDVPFGPGTQAVLLIPYRFPPAPHAAIAFLIDVAPGSDDPAHVETLARTSEQLKRSAAEAAARPQTPLLAADDAAGLLSAVRALSLPQSRRPALVYLTAQTAAPLCGDVALTCDEDVLALLTSRIWQSATPQTMKSPQEFGWALEYLTLQMLTEMQPNRTFPPELAAVLSRHFGEAGRHASSLEEILKGAGSQQDLQSGTIAENLIYLEDSSPASRVRAYDWLRAGNRAPEGYEPLGPAKQRRDALERAISAPSTAPSTQQGQP